MYIDFHFKDKTVARPSYLYNGDHYTCRQCPHIETGPIYLGHGILCNIIILHGIHACCWRQSPHFLYLALVLFLIKIHHFFDFRNCRNITHVKFDTFVRVLKVKFRGLSDSLVRWAWSPMYFGVNALLRQNISSVISRGISVTKRREHLEFYRWPILEAMSNQHMCIYCRGLITWCKFCIYRFLLNAA